MEQKKKLMIFSYQKLWKWNMKIYALSKDLPLPRAFPIRMLFYGVLGVAIAALIGTIPLLSGIPFVLQWAALPFGIAKLLESVKLDGKNPLRFFAGCIRYWICDQGTSMEHFKKQEAKQHKLKLYWDAGSQSSQDLYKEARPIRLRWTGGTLGGNAIVSMPN